MYNSPSARLQAALVVIHREYQSAVLGRKMFILDAQAHPAATAKWHPELTHSLQLRVVRKPALRSELHRVGVDILVEENVSQRYANGCLMGWVV